MASPVFSARFTPASSTAVSLTLFNVVANIFDGNGQYSGLDVQVNDVVFLDAFPSLSNANTVSRYRITQINSAGPVSVNVRLSWDDEGTVVDPSEITGTAGFVSRASTVDRLAWHAAPTIHGVPDYVIQYARNKESFGTIEGRLGGGGGGSSGTSLIKTMQSAFGSIIPAGTPLAKLPSGHVIPAKADSSGVQNVCGISAVQFSVSGLGSVYIPGQNISGAVSGFGFIVGKDIFLGENGGYVQSTSGFTGNNDVRLKIGFADCAQGSASSVAQDIIMLVDYILFP